MSPTRLGRFYQYTAPTTQVRYGETAPSGGGGGGGTPPPTGWTPAQVVSQTRPSGAGYVTYESLYVTGDSFQDVANRVPLLSGVPQYLTLPTGLFEIDAFNNGNYDGVRLGSGGAVGCRGIFGSGNSSTGTIIRPKANSATRIKPSTGMPAGTGIAGTVIRTEGVSGARYSNFRMEGQPMAFGGTQLYHSGLMMGSCPDAEVSWILGFGMSRGCGNAPDPETFGVNFYKCDRALIRDSEIDGRLPDGVTRWGASPFGWNGGGILKPQAPNPPAYDAKVYRVSTKYAVAGMPTWWQTCNITTQDLWSVGNGTGSGNQAGHGMNHEQSWGHIVHDRAVLKPKSTQGTEPDKTANSGVHFTVLNDSYDATVDMTFIEPIWDSNWGSTKMLIYAGYNTYTVPPGGDGTNNVASIPTVIKNGVTLGEKEHPLSGWNSADPALFFARIH